MPSETAPAMNPNALAIDDAARLLSKASGQIVTEATVRADLEAGAPTNVDGTLNLVHYAAWNFQQLSGQTDGD